MSRTFREYIEEAISLPGCFLAFTDEPESEQPASDERVGVYLNPYNDKDKEEAEEVLSVFHASKENSRQLLDSARHLLECRSYAIAVALAITSYEELGKSQIAADYYSGILPESKYKECFRKHNKTAYANRYAASGSHPDVQHGYFVDGNIARTLESIRQSALYVGAHNIPCENFSEDDAFSIVNKVSAHQDAIEHAEWLNDRIGSKALFK